MPGALYTQLNKQEKGGIINKIKRPFQNKGTSVIILLQVVIILLLIVVLINPATIIQKINESQVLSAVASLTTINTAESPVIAVISDAQGLREENAIQAEVYKDAQNGDYVLGYSDKMIIYRKQDNTIIYEGDSPTDMLTKNQETLMNSIISKAKEQGIIPSTSEEEPALSVVTDIAVLQAQDPTFYSSARNNDIIAIFSQAEVILLYNNDTGSIIKSGTYTTQIQSN
jgi:hypothetical protein